MPKFQNRYIETLIATGEWEIEPKWGLEQLTRYLQELELLESGSTITEIFQQMREAQQARILDPASLQQVLVGSDALLSPTQITPGSIAHLRLNSVVRMEDGWSSQGIRSLTNDLRAADNNPNIEGILLEVNSGGGQAIAGTTLQNTMEEISTPVVAFYQLAASAALKGILPADMIIAAGQEARIGSIGTMVSVNKRLVQFFQENEEDIYASKSNKKNQELREYLQGNRGPIIERLDRANEFFHQAVLAHRTIPEGDQEEVLSGAMFDSEQGIEYGLTDSIMGFEAAVRQLQQIAALRQSAPVTVRVPAFNNQNSEQMNLIKFLQGLIPIMNSKFNTEIQADADADTVLQAFQDMQSLEDIRQEIRTEVETANQGLQDQIDQLTQQVQTLTTQVTDQTAQVTTLTEERDNLAQQVTDLTGKLDDKSGGKVNSKMVKVGQFETVNNLMATVSPEGKSKY